MTLVKSFKGLRPTANFVEQVVAPPYDIVNRSQAKQIAGNNPYSFLHISKSEIDFPDSIDPEANLLCEKAQENLNKLCADQILVEDDLDSFYIYQIEKNGHRQIGLVAAIPVLAYQQGKIKSHEHTMPTKVQGRADLINHLKAQISPIILAYRSQENINVLLQNITHQTAVYSVSSEDGAKHTLWRISDTKQIADISEHFNRMNCLYVADGHHRSAAAFSAAKELGTINDATFLSAIFPDNQLTILGYHRLVAELNGYDSESFLAALGETFTINKLSEPYNTTREHYFGMYLSGSWYELNFKGDIASQSIAEGLDTHILTSHILEPLLGIDDLRRHPGIQFMGGEHSIHNMQNAIEQGNASVAFVLHPTPMAAIFDVADENAVMPPKSTWFDPKLLDGLVSYWC